MADLRNSRNGNSNSTLMTVLSAGAIIVTLLQIFLGVILTGINSNISRIEEQTAKRFDAIENGFIRTVEHKQFVTRIDGQLGKIEVVLKDIATRDEVNTRLGINSNSIIQVRNDVDVLKRDLGQTYSIKDALKEFQDRMKVLEQQSRGVPQPTK